MVFLLATAHATTCAEFAEVFPTMGALEVPIDAQPFITGVSSSSALPTLERMDTGAQVAVTVLTEDGIHPGHRLVPDTLLVPDTAYRVRWEGAFVEAEFSTSEGTDTSPPGPPVLLGHAWFSAQQLLSGEMLEFAPPTETALLELEAEVDGQGRGFPRRGVFLPFVGSIVCGTDHGVVLPGDVVHLTAWWVDVSGNRSEPMQTSFVAGEGIASEDTDLPVDTDLSDTDPPDTDRPVDTDSSDSRARCGCEARGGPAGLFGLAGLLLVRRREPRR